MVEERTILQVLTEQKEYVSNYHPEKWIKRKEDFLKQENSCYSLNEINQEMVLPENGVILFSRRLHRYHGFSMRTVRQYQKDVWSPSSWIDLHRLYDKFYINQLSSV